MKVISFYIESNLLLREGFEKKPYKLGLLGQLKVGSRLENNGPQANSLFGWFLKGKKIYIMSFQCNF